jgi:hypothetical protein
VLLAQDVSEFERANRRIAVEPPPQRRRPLT